MPALEFAVRVWPLGGRVGRVTRFAGSPVKTDPQEAGLPFRLIAKYYQTLITKHFLLSQYEADRKILPTEPNGQKV